MKRSSASKALCFVTLFERFISDTQKGRRLQPNGKPILKGTTRNYANTLRLLKAFAEKKQFELRIRSVRKLSQREVEREKRYWKKFYKGFSDYLYDDLGHFDNYAGQCFKNIKVFFSYLNKELSLFTGDFHKHFYTAKEDVAIFPLMPEELHFLIYDTAFGEGLPRRLRETKDFFVFGCTVALRVSDLFALNRSNLREVNGQWYLSVRSKKTSTDTLVKLPDYAQAILGRYQKQRKKLLPPFNISNLNQYIKLLLEKAGMTGPVTLTRTRRGRPVDVKRGKGQVSRLCDVATTHTMRRTAITTMLSLGMTEQVVRRISGHSPHSKEFYRYVLWAQTYQDRESEQVFARLKAMGGKVA